MINSYQISSLHVNLQINDTPSYSLMSLISLMSPQLIDVIDVFNAMLHHIDTTMYVDSTHFCHHKVVIMLSSYCHHIVFDVLMLYIISATTELHHIAIVLSSYCY